MTSGLRIDFWPAHICTGTHANAPTHTDTVWGGGREKGEMVRQREGEREKGGD